MNPYSVDPEPASISQGTRDQTATVEPDLPDTDSLTRLVVIGATPPPIHGVVIMTGQLLGALRKLDACAGHLDIRDPRPISTLGRLDFRNVMLGLRHARQLDRMLVSNPNAT